MENKKVVPAVATLGVALDAEARQLAAAHLPNLAWASVLTSMLDRVVHRQDAHQHRFERVEAAPRPNVQIDPPWFPPLALPRSEGSTSVPDPAPAHAETSEGKRLPSDVRTWLREVSGPGADAVRVHDDGAADALARRHDADGVTDGTDVYFRAGRSSLDDVRGRALLAHEVAHVSEHLDSPDQAEAVPSRRTPHDSGRPTAASSRPRNEEARALSIEHAVYELNGPPSGRPADHEHGLGSTTPPASEWRAGLVQGALAAQVARPTAAPAAQASAPLRAAVDRDLPERGPGPDLDVLRRDIVNDVLRQIRTDSERGG